MSSKPKSKPSPQKQLKSKVQLKRTAPAVRGRKNSSSTTNSRMGVSAIKLKKDNQPTMINGMDHLGRYMEYSHREFVATVTCPSTPSPGQVLYQRENLVAPDNTRLAQFAPLYYRWRPLKYKYHFIPTQPTTIGGTLVSGVDIEPGVAWTDGASNIAKARALEGSSMHQLFQASAFELPPTESSYTDLWCDPYSDTVDAEDRLAAAGRAVICIAAVGGITSGMVLGLIELEYRIRFYHSRLQNLSDMGSTTTGTIPAAEIFPSSTGHNVLRKVVEKLKNVPVNSIVNGVKILKQISNAKLWPDLSPGEEQKIGDTSPVGLPEGIYRVSMKLLTPEDGATDISFNSPGTWNFSNTGTITQGGDSTFTISDPLFGAQRCNVAGTVYTVRASTDYSFEVTSGATGYGYSDIATAITTTIGAEDILWYELSCTDNDQIEIFELDGTRRTVKKRQSPSNPSPKVPTTPVVMVPRPLRVKAK